jgi:hypothetical protein
MPQKIHLLNTKNRPAVGRISILAELGLRPIQAEPVQFLGKPGNLSHNKKDIWRKHKKRAVVSRHGGMM